jgi:hypothetical protein
MQVPSWTKYVISYLYNGGNMATKAVDQFANYAIIKVVESAANTLTFKKLETGISLTEKVAWVIARIEYIFLSPLAATFDSNGDAVYFGMSLSNSWSNPTIEENTIVDFNSVQRCDFGASANVVVDHQPYIKNFGNLPSGGVIVPPTPLYLFTKGITCAIPTTIVARIHYTLLSLAVDQYWELVESRRVLSS